MSTALENAFKKAQEKAGEPDIQQTKTEDNAEQQNVQQSEEKGDEVKTEEVIINENEEGSQDEVTLTSTEPAKEESVEDFFLEVGDETEQPPEVEGVKVDYSAIAEKIGVESLDTEDDLVSYISNLKEKAEAPKVEFANDAIAKANEIAAEGGNWEEYLQLHTIDYSTLSDKDAGVATLRNRGFDDDRIEGLLDTDAGLTMIETEGKRAKQDAEQRRKQKLNELEGIKAKKEQESAAQLEEQKKAQKAFHDDLKSELNRRAKSGFEGIKISDSYVSKLEKELTTGQGVMSLFMDDSGKPSAQKIIDTVMRARLFDKVLSRAKTVSKNDGKRDVMRNLHNTDLSGKPGVEPKTEADSVGRSYAKQLAGMSSHNPFAYKKE